MPVHEDLHSLLNHLENHATQYACLFKIPCLFEAVYKKKEKDGETEEATNALWECWVFGLSFENGALKDWCRPKAEQLDEKAYTYVRTRLQQTKNSVLRARYAHVLWCSPKKHIRHAEIAIESYMEAVRAYEQIAETAPSEPYGLEISSAALNAFGLAVRTKHRVDDTKAEVLRLARSSKSKTEWSFCVKHKLLHVILDDRKHFGKVDLTGLQEICWRLAKSRTRSNNECQVQDAMDMIDFGQKIDQRLGAETHPWDLVRAKCYEKKIHMRKEGDLAVPSFCLDAISYYRKAGRKAKAKTLERQYGRYAASGRFACVRIQVDMTSIIQEAGNLADKVIAGSSDEVVRYLTDAADLLPQCRHIRRMVSAGAIDPLLMDAPSSTVDDRGHITQRFVNADEREKQAVLQLYAREMELSRLLMIEQIILRALREEKLSFMVLRKRLQDGSWLGKQLVGQSPRKGTYHYCWLDLLEPSLLGYFDKTMQWLRDPTRVPNLILEIDSLTLKFEGMLRDLLRLAGTPTFKPKRGRGLTDGLTEERYIGDLLYTKEIKRLFEEDDLFFLRFLLSENSGYDLRNRVAHSLMLPEDYGVGCMHLLFLALLKLSRYDLAEAEQPVGSRCRSTFHRASCKAVRLIAPKNRLIFLNSEAAMDRGYEPCRQCRPDQGGKLNNLQVAGSESPHVLVIHPQPEPLQASSMVSPARSRKTSGKISGDR